MRLTPILVSLALIGSLASGCGDDDEPTDAGGFVRDSGSPDSGVELDTGVPEDLGTPDTGPEDLGTPDTGPEDLGTPDTGPEDLGTPDTGPEDLGTPDTGMVDLGMPDLGQPDAAVMDMGTPDAGMVNTDMQIAAVQTAATGASSSAVSPALPIRNALVTYVLPSGLASGSDPEAGFFVQASTMGPAIFVATATGASPVQVGDQVDLDVTEVDDTNDLRYVSGYSNLSVVSSGNAVSGLVQDLSSSTDLVTNLSDYESELMVVTGSVATERFAGGGYRSYDLDTAGLPNNGGDVRLRVPEDLDTALDLSEGCLVTAAGAVWRFRSTAQPSAWTLGDMSNVACPLSAVATSATEVVVEFDRNLDASSVNATGSQFSINGLTVSAAAASGSQVTLTTSMQTSGTSYTVTVANTVRDVTSSAVTSPNNTATFTGFAQVAGAVVINELYYDSPGSDAPNVFTEIHGPSGTSLSGYSLEGINGNGGSVYVTITLSGTIPSDGFYVITTAQANSTLAAVSDQTGDVDFQNGPDAVQLKDATGRVIDALQYGTASGFSAGEGTPAQDVSSGDSLSRNASHTDTDDNATDFSAATPTPGS